jgi:hypothetical protein
MTFATKYPSKYRPTNYAEVLEAVTFGHRVLVASFSERGHPINHRVAINAAGELEVIEFLTEKRRPIREFDFVYTYLD